MLKEKNTIFFNVVYSVENRGDIKKAGWYPSF